MKQMMPASTISSAKGAKNNTIQIFRALAIIAVVMIHTTPSGNYQVFCRPFINFAVATFLFLSGYLTKIENENWGAFYKKRIVRVLIPYAIWSILYSLYFHNLDKMLLLLLSAKSAAHLYYVFVYIQFVLLTPLLGKLATSKYQFLGWLVAPISLIVFRYYWLLTGQELNHFVSSIWTDLCLGWFTFYYLGLVLGNRIIEKNYSLKTLVILYVFSIVLQISESYGWLMLGEINCGTQIKLTSLLSSSLFMLIAYAILKSGQFNIRSRFLRMLGDYSFGIYLCHIIVMNFLSSSVPIYNHIPYPITSAIVILLSFCFCYIGDKVCGEKVSRWMGFK